MAKDPAFLFYSKDWLEGTAELTCCEKGIFIDLLCYQHQRGDIPSDTTRLARIVRISHEEFLKAWQVLSEKFQAYGDRMVNRKLSEVVTERSAKGHRNKISGTFAAVLRKADLSKKEYNYVRSLFKIEDFDHFNSDELTERLTEWLTVRLKSIAIENANANANEDVNGKEKGGMGEKEKLSHPLQIFISQNFPNVSGLRDQLSYADCEKLLNKYSKKEIEAVLQAMDNKKDLQNKYLSVYKTMLNWLPNQKPNDRNTNSSTKPKTDYNAIVREAGGVLADAITSTYNTGDSGQQHPNIGEASATTG